MWRDGGRSSLIRARCRRLALASQRAKAEDLVEIPLESCTVDGALRVGRTVALCQSPTRGLSTSSSCWQGLHDQAAVEPSNGDICVLLNPLDCPNRLSVTLSVKATTPRTACEAQPGRKW